MTAWQYRLHKVTHYASKLGLGPTVSYILLTVGIKYVK